MAKKKAAKKVIEEPASGKARVELRFDQDVFEGIRKLAESADVSVNQLLHGLARWAVDNGRPGEPKIVTRTDGSSYFTEMKEQPGIVFFGKPAQWVYDTEEGSESESGPGSFQGGKVFFMLDFTVRRVVRED